MNYSAHNIFSRIAGSDRYFIVNVLNGNADLLEPDEGREIEAFLSGSVLTQALAGELAEKGYLTDPEEEHLRYREAYLDFLDAREEDEIQIFFVPGYDCNFGCTYCYQDDYDNRAPQLSEAVIDAFFTYVDKAFAGRRKYITLFGGEPLLPSARRKGLISYFLGLASERTLEVCIVTNGYALEEYLGILRPATVREIQVTLDGTGPVHDSRRFLKGGGPTFDRIVKGIDTCLESGLPINLRMVADRENIGNLPELARFAIGKGWTSHPLFKTQIGRNYELHHCQAAPEKLFSRIGLYEELFSLTGRFPEILEFYKPAYSVSRFLKDNGALPDPLFDGCPACKTEWAFDYAGGIYPCTATVGKTGESLGTFWPETGLDLDRVAPWENRDVTSISQCRSCNLSLACGGGCGSVAKNRTGSVCSPDCRPVRELLELGFAAWFPENGGR